MVGETLVASGQISNFIGLTFENRFKFDAHIDVMCKNVNSGIFLRSLS